jgi:hypothetical protein
MNTEPFSRMDRRTAVKWMLTAAASAAFAPQLTHAANAPKLVPLGSGYGTDPDLLKTYNPGELWPLTFTKAQRATAVALCDVIIPADEKSPAASTVGVPDFIDEWISAPYPLHRGDQSLIVEGLDWIETESQKRFGQSFPNLIGRQQRAICDDICFEKNAAPEFKKAAHFFARYRDLTAGGFYTTPEGMKDIGYIGNVPLATFDGPPPELIKKLGLTV